MSVPFPDAGDTSWYDWATQVDQQARSAAPGLAPTAIYTSSSHIPVSGELAQYNPSANLSITLGAAAAEQRFGVANVATTGAFTVMLGRAGTDTIDGSTSLVLNPGERVVLIGVSGGYSLESRTAINGTFVVADEAAMLALTAQRGDVAIRQDLIDDEQPAVYILSADAPATLANWINLPVPADAVASVAGKTGAVTLGKADVGLDQVDNTPDVSKPVSSATQTALDAKADASYVDTQDTALSGRISTLEGSSGPDLTDYYSKEETDSEIGTAVAGKADTSSLAAVATSGSYDDLVDTPAAVDLSGYATTSYVDAADEALDGRVDALEARPVIDSPDDIGAQVAGDYATSDALTAHTGDTSNPHGVTKAQVGLGDVDDTSDADKPISSVQQSALDAKADLAYVDTQDGALSDRLGALEGSSGPDLTDYYTKAQVDDADGALSGRLDAVEARPVIDSPDDIGAQVAGDYATSDELTTGLADKADTSALATVATSGAYGDLSGKPTIPATYSQLTGTVPQAAIPAVALTDFLGAVATQAAMLALTGQRGDWCTRTDLGTDWQLIADDPTQLANWREHVYPASPVQSVNGRSGAVTGLAEASDVTSALAGKQATGDYATNSALTSGLAGKADSSALATVATSGSYDDLSDKPTISGSGAVDSVNTKTGAVVLAAADVGATRLSVNGTYADNYNLDTTAVTPADIGAQPVDADLTALAALDSTVAGVSATDGSGWIKKTYAQLKTALGLVKTDVGLGNVDNTADTAKPVSTAQQTAINGRAPTSLTVSAGTGLTGGGDLTANRSFAVSYGTAAGTAAQGNDARFTTITANTQTGTAYTLVLADAGKAVEMNNAAANALTIPPNSSVAFPVGTVVEVHQYGAGQTTITAGAGVTLRAPDGAKTSKQYASGSLRKRATDEWVLAGSVTS